MKVRVQRLRASRGGYSLIELMLTTVLLLMFAGVAVVSLQTMSGGARLNEGAIRFEGLLRLARAEAANSGHRVRISFVQETNTVDVAATNLLNQVQITWEPNPVTEPEVFADLRTTRWGVEEVNEAVGVETVRLTEAEAAEAEASESALTGEESTDIQEFTFTGESDLAAAVSPLPAFITFNPDGSCDSAEITLAARGGEDPGRVVMRLEGLTGTISRVTEAESGSEENREDSAGGATDGEWLAPH